MARKPAFISHSSEREAQIQSRLLDVLEARYRRKIAGAIVAESDRLATEYEGLGFAPPASDQHYQDVRAIYLELAEASARTFGRRIVTQGKAMGLLEIKESTLWDLFRSLANAWVNLEAIRRRITSVSETTRNQIIIIIQRGQDDGLGVEAIARNIRDAVPDLARTRSRIIARTETHGAANFASDEVAKTTGLQLDKEWVSVEDIRTRRHGMGDEFDHASMNGQRVPQDQPFLMPWRGRPPMPIMYPGEAGKPGGAVINCLPPWAKVRLAGIKHVMFCEYSGDLFEFSFAGPVNFTVTANHPVLTLSGWKPARHVVEGDQLIYAGVGDSIRIGMNADIKDRHSRIDELYNSLKPNSLKPLSGVVRANAGAVNFHGDMPDSDVDIVAAQGHLRDAMIAEGRHLFGDISLADTHVSKGLLLANRMVNLGHRRLADHSDRLMSGSGAGQSRLGCGHGGLSAVSLADAGTLNAQIREAAINHAARDIEGLRHGVGAVSGIEHALDLRQETFANGGPSGVLRPFEVVKVAAIKRFHYRGPVYNCETDTGLIVSDGIVSHNCRCAVVRHVRGGLLGD
jgi:hypothetical protein